jgi:hypothetical protein
MGTAPAVLLEDALSQGFAVASHALDNAGHNCNLVTEAESLVLTKELVAERFGPLRYTIGTGCSGGSLVQQQVANAYPGVYQGILPQCSFTDTWSSAQQYVDYVGLRAVPRGPRRRSRPASCRRSGRRSSATPTRRTRSPSPRHPEQRRPSRAARACRRATSTARRTRRRALLAAGLHGNVFGKTATARPLRPISNVGVQYGLSGLLAGLGAIEPDPTRPPLTVDQFVALNANAGGYDIDFNPHPRAHRRRPVGAGARLPQRRRQHGCPPRRGRDHRPRRAGAGRLHDVYRKYSCATG